MDATGNELGDNSWGNSLCECVFVFVRKGSRTRGLGKGVRGGRGED